MEWEISFVLSIRTSLPRLSTAWPCTTRYELQECFCRRKDEKPERTSKRRRFSSSCLHFFFLFVVYTVSPASSFCSKWSRSLMVMGEESRTTWKVEHLSIQTPTFHARIGRWTGSGEDYCQGTTWAGGHQGSIRVGPGSQYLSHNPRQEESSQGTMGQPQPWALGTNLGGGLGKDQAGPVVWGSVGSWRLTPLCTCWDRDWWPCGAEIVSWVLGKQKRILGRPGRASQGCWCPQGCGSYVDPYSCWVAIFHFIYIALPASLQLLSLSAALVLPSSPLHPVSSPCTSFPALFAHFFTIITCCWGAGKVQVNKA